MLIGPLFFRELVTSPRRVRHYLIRGGYQVALFVLFWTAWQELVGGQRLVNLGGLARFGFLLFQILALVQLVTVIFLAPLSVAGTVAQEKDRRTLVLLLMTDLTNRELVLGKLFSGLLPVGTMLLAALPLFSLCLLLGGVSGSQILAAFLVTGSAALALASLGCMIAFWREKTFQTLALVVLGVVFFLVISEALPFVIPGEAMGGMTVEDWCAVFSPRRALLSVLDGDPLDWSRHRLAYIGHPSLGFALFMVMASLVLNGVSIARVRVWNPSGEIGTPREIPEDPRAAQASRVAPARAAVQAALSAEGNPQVTLEAAADRSLHEAEPTTLSRLLKGRKASPQQTFAPSRRVWSNPILWRETCTRAYGRRPIIIKAAYGLLFALVCAYLSFAQPESTRYRLLPPPALALVVVSVVSLLLVNAQAATSVSTERDGGALELLLVTDVTPPEFVFGKLGGAIYNSKEILLLPLGLVGYLWRSGTITLEWSIYLGTGLILLYGFATMLGVHAGLTFSNSRIAIANSLGTVFFLFVGIFVCINLIIASGANFTRAMLSFLVFILGGGVGLFASLGAKNPSSAIFLAAMLCPFLTFYAIINYRMESTLGVFVVIGAAFGWAIAAMLIPAIHEFDVALGRTTRDAPEN